MTMTLRNPLYAWLCIMLAAGLILDDAAALPALLDDDDDGCQIVDDDGDDRTDGFCAGQALVRLTANADIEQLNDNFDTETLDQIAGQDVFLLELPPGSDEQSVVANLEGDNRVIWADLNRVDQAPEGRPQRFFLRGDTRPRPGSLDRAYAPQLIGIPAGGACVTGEGVTVAIIDSGIDPSHPAFASTSMRGEWNAFSNQDGPGNVDDIGNDEDDDGDGFVDEMTGHGTHVAGIVSQIAPGATIMPIKALDSDGVGQAFYLARAIHYAAGRNADVINLSLGSTFDARVVHEATEAALIAGIFVAAAAGNNGGEEPREFPATQSGVFGVAATDRQDRPAEFTSTHPTLSLSAPGVDIVSPFPLDQPPGSGSQLGSPYALWSGTSMATPWVAGAASLLLAQNPSWGPNDLAARLQSTADPIDGFSAGMGSGRLDAGAALACAGDGGGGTIAEPTPPPGPTVGPTPDDDDKKDNDKKKKKKKKGKKKNKRKNRR